METQSLDGAFADPVLDAQGVFRAVMDAMARPGTARPVAAKVNPPAPLTPTAAAIALTLCDHDTPVWLDPALQASPAVKAWLGFHCGAPLAGVPSDAAFAFVSDPAEVIALDNFAQGTQEFPDRSATIVLQVSTLSAGATLLLDGPGIEKAAFVAPAPVPRHFTEQWKQNRQRFPRGVDIILAGPESVVCLPRTTRIKPAEV